MGCYHRTSAGIEQATRDSLGVTRSERSRVVPEFGFEHLREVIRPPFRIVYRLDDDRVRVVRVWCSERLLELP